MIYKKNHLIAYKNYSHSSYDMTILKLSIGSENVSKYVGSYICVFSTNFNTTMVLTDCDSDSVG
jgi:hypothetical protein